MKMLLALLILVLFAGFIHADNVTNPQQILLPPTLQGRELVFLPQSAGNGTTPLVVVSQSTDAVESIWKNVDAWLKSPSIIGFPWYFAITLFGIIIFFADETKVLKRTPFGVRMEKSRSFYSSLAGLIALFTFAAHYGDFIKILGIG